MRRRRVILSCFISILVLCGRSARAIAQSSPENPAAKLPEFSVVLLKPSPPEGRPSFTQPPDGLTVRHTPVFWLIQSAYGMPEARMVLGAPGWAHDEPYDLIAKVDEADLTAIASLTPVQRLAMLQPVLEERMNLKYHYEMRDLQDFALVVAKGGPNAANLKPSGPAHAQPAWKYTGRYALSAQGFTIEDLCHIVLSTEAQRLVIDRTGLAGRYDVSLRWSRETTPSTDGPAAAEEPGPSIFAALPEQLGLRLEPIKVATKILVIDSIQRPSGKEQ